MAKLLKTLLSGDQEFRPLLNKALALTDLQQQFASVAPPYLAQSSMVLGLQLGTLSIAVANPTVAAKLRQLAPELVVMLQNRGCEVSGIRVKVQVAYARTPPKHVPRILTKTAQNALNELSESLGDTPLRHALQKMIQKKA